MDGPLQKSVEVEVEIQQQQQQATIVPAAKSSSTKSVASIMSPSNKYAIFLFSQIFAVVAIFRSSSITTNIGNINNNNDDSPLLLPSAKSKSKSKKKKMTTTTTTKNRRRLPTLEELTSIDTTSGQNYSCPKGYKVFEDIVLPRNITHANDRKIPKVIHITAKSRCVTSKIKKHILKWKFPDHSLYFHDDNAVYKLLNYAINDRYGHEIVQNFTNAAMCMTSGATISDMWRYTLLYHYGGIYTDIDNAPGKEYSTDFIKDDTDAFFFVEAIGTMSQYYFASSKYHPILSHALNTAVNHGLWTLNNVMKNIPAKTTGPRAIKNAMIDFREAINITSDGYEKEGIYNGGLGYDLESTIPWYNTTDDNDDSNDNDNDNDNDNNEYPFPSELFNRTVTIVGEKGAQAKRYINRGGMSARQKVKIWKAMNMTHYHGQNKVFPRNNEISCKQHVSRMINITVNETTSSSSIYDINNIASLLANYEYRGSYYYDKNTNEQIIPWKHDDDNKDKPKKKNKRDKKKSDREKKLNAELESLKLKVDQQKIERDHQDENVKNIGVGGVNKSDREKKLNANVESLKLKVDQQKKRDHQDGDNVTTTTTAATTAVNSIPPTIITNATTIPTTTVTLNETIIAIENTTKTTDNANIIIVEERDHQGGDNLTTTTTAVNPIPPTIITNTTTIPTTTVTLNETIIAVENTTKTTDNATIIIVEENRIVDNGIIKPVEENGNTYIDNKNDDDDDVTMMTRGLINVEE